VRHAVVLGDGTPAFQTEKALPLRLIDTGSREGSDNLLIRYDARPVA
jgi:hypothetical protein